MSAAPGPHRNIILFDGGCGLCNRFVLSVIGKDPNGVFRFAPLASPQGKALLKRHRIPETLDSVVLVENGSAFTRSRAVRKILQRLGVRGWTGFLLAVTPAPLADIVYRLVAAFRKQLFPHTACRLMAADLRGRFQID